MTSVYVTNVTRKVTVSPGYTSGSGGGGGVDLLPLNNTWTGSNIFANDVVISPGASTEIATIFKGFSGQSANLTEWRNSSNAALARVTATGDISTNKNIFVGGTLSAGAANKAIVFDNASAIPTGSPGAGGILYVESGSLKFRDGSGNVQVPVAASGAKGDLLVHNGTSWVKVSLGVDNNVLIADSSQTAGVRWGAGGSGGGHVIQEEGSGLAQRAALNFIGSAVTVTDDNANNRTNVTITGGGGGYSTVQANGSSVTARSIMNFSTAFTAVDDGSSKTNVGLNLGTASTQAAAGNHLHTGVYEVSGAVASGISAHVSAVDPHAGTYITSATASATYAPIAAKVPTGGAQGYALTKNSASDYDVGWAATGGAITSPASLTSTAVSQIPLTITGATGQTESLIKLVGGGISVLTASNDGQLNLGVMTIATVGGDGSPSGTSMLKIFTRNISTSGIIVKGRATQSADLAKFVSKDGTAVNTTIDSDGVLTGKWLFQGAIIDNGGSAPTGFPDGGILFERAS